MLLHKADAETWHLFSNAEHQTAGTIAAEIELDVLRQVKRLVLRACTPEEAVAAMQLTYAHCAQFQRGDKPNGSIFGSFRSKERPTDNVSDMLMSFDRIPPEIAALSEEKLRERLEWEYLVVRAAYASCEEAFAAAFARVEAIVADRGEAPLGLSIQVGKRSYYTPALLKMNPESPRLFRFWKDVHKQDDHHVIPPYHPKMRSGAAHMPFMINGTTDALIAHHHFGINYIQCPVQAVRQHGGLPRGWVTEHPIKAEGYEVPLMIDPSACQSQEAVDHFVTLLTAMLGLNESYVGVSGGFEPPGRRRGKRGSETHAVWTYNTLKQEGRLEGASTPSWLFEEGWVKREVAPKTDDTL